MVEDHVALGLEHRLVVDGLRIDEHRMLKLGGVGKVTVARQAGQGSDVVCEEGRPVEQADRPGGQGGPDVE